MPLRPFGNELLLRLMPPPIGAPSSRGESTGEYDYRQRRINLRMLALARRARFLVTQRSHGSSVCAEAARLSDSGPCQCAEIVRYFGGRDRTRTGTPVSQKQI